MFHSDLYFLLSLSLPFFLSNTHQVYRIFWRVNLQKKKNISLVITAYTIHVKYTVPKLIVHTQIVILPNFSFIHRFIYGFIDSRSLIYTLFASKPFFGLLSVERFVTCPLVFHCLSLQGTNFKKGLRYICKNGKLLSFLLEFITY